MPKYDIHIQIVPIAEYDGTKFYSFGKRRTLSVRGIQKLVNVFAKYLLTPAGSDPLDSTYGTDLTALIGSNVVPADAQDVLLLSVDKAVKAMQLSQSDGTPDDERIANATVTAFLSLPDVLGFAAQIHVTNILNQGLTFLLPTLQVRR